MKKILLMLVAVLGFSFVANAQEGVCKVSNANGASVVVNVIDCKEDGTVNLSISSDCSAYVNVSFTLKYDIWTPTHATVYGGESQPFNVLVAPNSSTPKQVEIRLRNDNIRMANITRVNVYGARCKDE